MAVGREVYVNGIQLHYLDYEGENPPLILMHGLTANAHFMDGLAYAGLTRAVRLIAPDLRGRGLSAKPDAGYTMADHAADILGLVDTLGIERGFVGGHSFGGLVTYYLAAHHPDRVSKCVVLDAPGSVSPFLLDQIRPALERLRQVLPSWEAYLQMVKAMPYYTGWWDEALENTYRADMFFNADGTVQSRMNPDHIQQAAQGVLDTDWPAVVAKISAPTLLLRATDSFGPPGFPALLSREDAELTLQRLAQGKLQDFPGNHITYLFGAHATAVVEAIVNFLQ